MPNIRFNGANHPRARAPFSIECLQRLTLNRVANRCARAVCLDIGDILRLKLSHRQRFLNHRFLRRATWHRQALTRPILIDRRSAHHRQNIIMILHGFTKAFQHHHATAFPAHIAVCADIKPLTPSIGRQHACFGKGETQVGRKNQIDAGSERQIAFPIPQALASQMKSDQRT